MSTMSLMSAGGISGLKGGEQKSVQPTFASNDTASVVLEKDCKALLVVFQRSGYGGSNIAVTAPGLTTIFSANNFVNANFGNWGAMTRVAYGVNMKKGMTLSLSGSGNINRGGSVTLTYIN